MLRGEPTDGESVNKVEDVPGNFKEWAEKNEARIATARENGTLPGFVRENQKFLDVSEKLQGTKFNTLKSVFNHITFKEDSIAEQRATAFTDAQIHNHEEVSRAIQLRQGDRMTFKDADSGRSNPKYAWFKAWLGIESDYNINCTLTVATHELRMRGWDVTSLAFDGKNNLMRRMTNGAFNELWIDPKTNKIPIVNNITAKTVDKMVVRFEKATSEVGRYHIRVNWRGSGGHVFCVDRLPNGSLRVYDPQSNELNINDWMEDINLKKGIGILRVDNMLINPNSIKQIVKPYHSSPKK